MNLENSALAWIRIAWFELGPRPTTCRLNSVQRQFDSTRSDVGLTQLN